MKTIWEDNSNSETTDLVKLNKTYLGYLLLGLGINEDEMDFMRFCFFWPKTGKGVKVLRKEDGRHY